MKKIALFLLSSVMLIALPVRSVLAEPGFMLDVNSACGEIAVECSSCHILDDIGEYTDNQGIYKTSGACAFCSADATCSPVREDNDELLARARGITNDYFEKLFREFMSHMMATGMMEPDGTITDPMIFATVFPECSQIAPLIGGDFSRNEGGNIRRVTNRTRNARNTPDNWESGKLEKFESMAKGNHPRTQFDITKPDGSILPTKEFEQYAIVSGENDMKYFRYMRSITMPGPPNEPPYLPCLKCHGTLDQLAPGLVNEGALDKGALEADYPYDMALGYKKGDIRGAWTVKIPIIDGED